MITRIIKQPAERLVLAAGAAVELVSVNVAARGLVAGVILTAAVTIADGQATLTLDAGTNGESYLVTLVLELADGSEHESEFDVQVIDASWAMPGGGAPMLSVADFVARFGVEEVIRMTDAGDGRIDAGMLISALTDAQALAEGYISGRYALPMDPVPTLVQVLVADIARARLYTNEPPKSVEASERNAMKALRDIQTGQISLGVAAPASSDSVTDPVMFVAGKRRYPDNLDSY